jgi:hypothetical protein
LPNFVLFGISPRGVDDVDTLLADVPEKLKMICHAEANAIMNAARIGVPLENATIYVTKFPCLSCCNAIIQAGISRIYTHDHRYWSDDPLDKEHFRKPIVLQPAGIQVDAPFHPDFSIAAHLTKPGREIEAVPLRKAPTLSTDLLSGNGQGSSETRSDKVGPHSRAILRVLALVGCGAQARMCRSFLTEC